MNRKAPGIKIKLIGDLALLALFLFFGATISEYVLVQIIQISTSAVLDKVLTILCITTVIAFGGSIALVGWHLFKNRDTLYPPESSSDAASGRRES